MMAKRRGLLLVIRFKTKENEYLYPLHSTRGIHRLYIHQERERWKEAEKSVTRPVLSRSLSKLASYALPQIGKDPREDVIGICWSREGKYNEVELPRVERRKKLVKFKSSLLSPYSRIYV